MKKILSIAGILAISGIMAWQAFAIAGVTTTSATGGEAISADTFTSSSTTALSGPVVSEDTTGAIGVGDLVLTAPAGFEFDTTAAVNVVVTGTVASGTLATVSSPATVASTTITATVSAASTVDALSVVTWSGIKVVPTTGTVTSGNITLSGTALSGTDNAGILTLVPGAATQAAISADTTTVGLTTGTSTLTVTVKDQYGNNVTDGTSITLYATTPGVVSGSGDTSAGVATRYLTGTAIGTSTLTVSATSSLSVSGNNSIEFFNIAPVANAQSVTVNEDGSLPITLTGSDVDGNTLTFATTSNPSNGALSGFNASTGAVTYTPTANWNGSDSFTFTVYDGNLSSEATVSITVDPINDVPSFSVSTSTIDITEDSGAYSLTGFATSISTGPTNESSQTVSFIVGSDNATMFSSGPSVNASGDLTFTPAAHANGTVSVTVKIQDNGSTSNGGVDTSASSTLTINIAAVNDVPSLATIGAKIVNENANLSFTLSATDVEGSTLTYFASNLPVGATFNTGTGAFSWTPNYTQAGTYNSVHFEVSDGTATSTEDITITVNNVDRAPVLTSIGSQTVNENAALAFTASSTDPDGDTVELSATGLPTGATFATTTGEFSWTPDYTQAGGYSVTVYAAANGATTSEVVSVTVNNVNRNPDLSVLNDMSLDEETALTFTASSTDPDSDTITYSLTGTAATAGASINSSTGEFSWTPTEAQGPGTYTATVTATDNGTPASLTDAVTFNITVGEINNTPATSAISITTNEDTAATTALIGTDSDIPTQSLTYVVTVLPTNGTAVITGSNVEYTPAANYNGADSFQYVATDGVATSSPSTTSVTVNAINDDPVLATITNPTGDELTAITFTASATDIDTGTTFTYSLSGEPAGAAINSSTGGFSWTPTEAQGGYGTFTFDVEVSDGNGGTDSQSITVTVNEVNEAPIGNALSITTNEDTSVSDTVTGSDVDDPTQTLTFATTSDPAHGTLTSFDASTGAFTYMPEAHYYGTDSFSFRMYDGETYGATNTVDITINSVNDVPTISLRGPNPLLLTKDYFGYVDEMVTATDVEDGDISANAVIVGSPIDTSTIGSFLVTYSITDSNGASVTVDRPVNIIAQIGGAGGPSGEVGCRDPRATNYSSTAGYDGITCIYAQTGQVLGVSTSTEQVSPLNGTTTLQIVVVASTSTPMGEVLGTATSTFTRNLRLGLRGTDVGELQKILAKEGFFTHPSITNYFGVLTRAALIKWQLAHELPGTGYFGELSRAFLSK